MWKPLERTKESWERAQTTLGKTAVVLFYFYVWIMIFRCILNLVLPTTTTLCMYRNLSPTTVLLVDSYKFSANLYLLIFLLYAGYHQTSLANVSILMVVMATNYLNWLSTERQTKATDPVLISEACWTLMSTANGILSLVFPLCIWGFAVAESLLDWPLAPVEENQPLMAR